MVSGKITRWRSRRTEFEMLFRAVHKLGHPRREILRKNEEFASVRMLLHEVAQDFNKVAIQGHLLNGKIVH